MERVPFHDREMEISIQYHVMLIRQSNDQILMRCYIIHIVGSTRGSDPLYEICSFEGKSVFSSAARFYIS